MSTDKDTVRAEYEKGGYTYQKVADYFKISVNTVKSWAKRDKDEGNPWIKGNKNKVATESKKLQPNNKVATEKKVQEDAAKEKKEVVNDIDREIVEEVIENNELTDKQQLFCIHYIKCFNATKAYQKVYQCDYITANTNGPRLLVNACIKEEIQRLKQGKLNRAMLSEDDIFQKYMDIAFTDITDYVTFGTKEIETEIGPMTVSYVDFTESVEVDGTLISEVSKGKDGVKVKLQDKMKALQWLSDRMDLLPTEAREKLKLAQERFEFEKERDNKDKETNVKVTIVDDIGSD